jgi:LacI family transcriptional regulator
LDRRRGYESALRDHGFEPDPSLVLPMHYGGAPFDGVARTLVQDPRPTAAFAWSDDAALRVMAEARAMGLQVPTDISVVGYDSTEVCNHTSPTLTSVGQDIPGIAAQGVAILAALMRSDAPEQSDVLVRPALCVRGSCAPAQPAGGTDHEN